MKRSFTIILIAFTLVFSFTCCQKSNRSFVLRSFEAFALLETAEEKYKGKFVCEKQGRISFTLTYPEILGGIVIASENQKKTVSHNGVSVNLSKNSPVYKICDILTDFSQKQHKIKKDGTVSIKGEADNIAYEIVVDCGEMEIKEIITKNIRCSFGNKPF